ncbi:hypothetical protein A2307_05170 [Candidatus Peregrinibacteria bacterium RIFOXYB2_FULL_33_20]|nr:MAG: hypothetical protein A2307_05170 [Candidatus Peregrinibacteria bacterium RIFOXYB2_FULL_33_20]
MKGPNCQEGRFLISAEERRMIPQIRAKIAESGEDITFKVENQDTGEAILIFPSEKLRNRALDLLHGACDDERRKQKIIKEEREVQGICNTMGYEHYDGNDRANLISVRRFIDDLTKGKIPDITYNRALDVFNYILGYDWTDKMCFDGVADDIINKISVYYDLKS